LAFLLDTDVAIHLRDGSDDVWTRIRALDPPFSLSIVSRVELENGVYREPPYAGLKRSALDALLTEISTIDFGDQELGRYRAILEAAGFTKNKINDRMIAATALAHDLTLITMNGRDFRDVPGLKLVVWETPDP